MKTGVVRIGDRGRTSAADLPQRVDVGKLEDVQIWASRLNITTVELVAVMGRVGTWVPAIERELHAGKFGV